MLRGVLRRISGLMPEDYRRKEKMTALGAGIAALACIGAGLGIGIATGHATDAIAKQPEADNKIMRNLLLGSALAEATAIYGFVLGLMILFVA